MRTFSTVYGLNVSSLSYSIVQGRSVDRKLGQAYVSLFYFCPGYVLLSLYIKITTNLLQGVVIIIVVRVTIGGTEIRTFDLKCQSSVPCMTISVIPPAVAEKMNNV